MSIYFDHGSSQDAFRRTRLPRPQPDSKGNARSRVQIVDPQTAPAPARNLLEAVQAQLGVTPNVIRVLANSPKALEGFLGLYCAASGFALDKATQERIALAVAEGNA